MLAQPVDIVAGYSDLTAKSRMLSHVLQFGRVLRILVQQAVDSMSIGGFPTFVFVGPNGGRFNNQGFAVGIKLIGHEKTQSGANAIARGAGQLGSRQATLER